MGHGMTNPVRRLWIAATQAELACAPCHAGLATGCGPLAGIPLATYLATHAVEEIVGIGIAGAYPGSVCKMGGVYRIRTERTAGWGAESGRSGGMLTLDFPGLRPEAFQLFCPPDLVRLEEADSCTVAIATGTAETALARRALGADLENMEGLAWAMAARFAGVRFAEVRAVSNMAGPRDPSAWNIPLALQSLSDALAESSGNLP